MVGGALKSMTFKYACVLLILLLLGCQSKLGKIGQEHAKEVVKWQELARYAGDELKYLGLTVTAGVQINQSTEATSYSIVKVRLNRDANLTEIDLLSPEFAKKFACGKECQRLGLYDSNFAKQRTQLTSFFFTEEGRFFEFYGRLTRLNQTLADYRASSPAILKKYLSLMLNREMVFSSLSEFLDHLEMHVTEDKLLAFSKSGFISPVEDRLSSTFLDDVIANLPSDWQLNNLKKPDDEWPLADLRMPDDDWPLADMKMPDDDWPLNDLKMPDADWPLADLKMPDDDWPLNDLKMPDADWQANDLRMPDADWQANDLKMTDDDWPLDDLKMPNDNWQVNDLRMPDDNWDSTPLTPDSLLVAIEQDFPSSFAKRESWEQARQNTIRVGSIACTFSDNSFGVVQGLETNNVTLKVIAQARVNIDGMKLYPQPGYLFTAAESFYFVKESLNKTYLLSDIAICNIENFKPAQELEKA